MSRVRNPQGGALMVDQRGISRDFYGGSQVELAYMERTTDLTVPAAQEWSMLISPFVNLGKMPQVIQVDMYIPQITITGGGTTLFKLYMAPQLAGTPYTLLRSHRVDQSTTLSQPILCSNVFAMPYGSYPTTSYCFAWNCETTSTSAAVLKAGNGVGSNMAPAFLRVTSLGGHYP
jgi:hypothetical protein